jgi:NADH dehydrogenase [ubiquinone] 1 alpha subcomplex assembly factor 7
VTDLAHTLAQRIREHGPISVADYMAAASAHYYGRRDPFGVRGDFVTAPEVSQMFGELLGLWCVAVWEAIGAPARFILAELGPGRGTLMRDALRAARGVPQFLTAAELHLVETSPIMRRRQGAALLDHRPQWHSRPEDLPAGPMLLIANEFFDVLPVRQFVRGVKGWQERHVGLSDDRFAFMLDEAVCEWLPAAPEGSVREVSPAALAYADWLGRRVVEQEGAALLIDYGYNTHACGDTLQAVRAHRRHPVLSDPGEADLTAHVDFAAIADAASNAGARIHGPLEQGAFLRALGIDMRAERLMAAAPSHAATVAAGLRRLTAPDAMGSLFKALAIAHPRLQLPAFQ